MRRLLKWEGGVGSRYELTPRSSVCCTLDQHNQARVELAAPFSVSYNRPGLARPPSSSGRPCKTGPSSEAPAAWEVGGRVRRELRFGCG
jgi:hypothetical protein